MSLEVLVARTGDRLNVNISTFASFDALKSWLAQQISVPASHQIILTQHGKQARFQTIASESKVYLYDRQFVSGSASSTTASDSAALNEPRIELPTDFPGTVSDKTDGKAWQNLFKARKRWALDLEKNARGMTELAEGAVDACFIIEDGVTVAVNNLESHVQTLEDHYGQANKWAEHFVEEQTAAMSSLETVIQRCRSLPVDLRFRSFLPLLRNDDGQGDRQGSRKQATLDRYVATEQTQSALSVARLGLKLLSEEKEALGKQVNDIVTAATQLFDSVEKTNAQSIENMPKEASQIMEEIGSTVQAITSDCDHVLSLPVSQQSITTASKVANHHTKKFLPNLKNLSTEMGDVVKDAADQRKQSSLKATRNMQKVALNEASFAQVHSKVKNFDVHIDKAEAFEYISLLAQLPFVYGALLMEAVRRHEWAEKMRSESANLAEDIAGYREEEERRRKKWLKNIGQFVDEEAATASALNFEVNIESEDNPWPETNRQTVTEYISALRGLSGMDEVVEELDASYKELDRPTRRQVKTSKFFKNGSMHEASAGRGSFLLRDNEELKALRDVNVRQDDEIKGHKSRIRKLEDLLYKQSQPGRANAVVIPSSSPIDPVVFEPGSTSPIVGEHAGAQRSASSRKPSATRSPEEKALARRIVDLETKMMEEKQKRELIETTAQDKTNTTGQVQAELEETRSTKRDLMANLEAQQREFANERRYLEEQSRKQKDRIEELEEEADQKDDALDKLHFLEREIEQKSHNLSTLEFEIKRRDEIQDDQDRMLRTAYSCLEPESSPPEPTADLVNRLEELAERSSRYNKDVANSLATTRSEVTRLQTLLDVHKEESSSSRDRIQALEEDLISLKNESSADKARAGSLTDELDDARRQLRNLRARFAEGETGSEALTHRLQDQASRAGNLSTQLAEAKSHINSLDVELSSLQRKHQNLVTSSNAMSKTLNTRNAKAKDLTSRLVAFYQELPKLLDSLGLSITRHEGVMSIQRTSKLASASTTLPDAHISSTTDSASQVNFQTYDATLDFDLTSWIEADTPEIESERFTQLVSKVDEFSLNTFSEAVIKLRRDVEWTGKKWKMEARNYRDKYHRSQNEAHEKIAFRSFKEGDQALFLPTRNQATRPWAAFNIGAPHYFLREQDSHKLRNREWLVARISKVEERVVDLSKTMGTTLKPDDRHQASGISEAGTSAEDDNPFELSDGLRWYLLDAQEEKLGAPSTPGLGKSTVASAHVDVKGSIRMNKAPAGNDASGKLNKSLESRRSSSNSKRGSISGAVFTKDSNALEIAEGMQDTGTTSVRPNSRSSSGAAVTGVQTGSPKLLERSAGQVSNEERPKTIGGASPSRTGAFLGMLGSPPKSWFSRRNSGLREVSPSRSSLRVAQAAGTTATHSSSRESISSGDRIQNDTTMSSKQRPSPTKSRESPAKPAAPSHQNSGAWESLWTLDFNIEEGSKNTTR